MKILCIGDIVADEGVEYLQKMLPYLRRKYRPDAVIVNGENSATYNGISRRSYNAILNAGADVVTGGNHSFQLKDAGELHQTEKRLLAPCNIDNVNGASDKIVLDFGKVRLCVINLSGTLFIKGANNPFEHITEILNDTQGMITVVDFHAEATSEKRAMGFMLDGEVSLVFGTHTHVQTNDAQILPGGTGYITDIGMTGVKHSVLGKDKGVAVNNFLHPNNRQPIKNAVGECMLCGIFAEIDDNTKKCVSIQTVCIDNQTKL